MQEVGEVGGSFREQIGLIVPSPTKKWEKCCKLRFYKVRARGIGRI